MPTPRPEMSDTSVAVEKPGAKINRSICSRSASPPAPRCPLSRATCNTRSRFDAAAIVLDGDEDIAARLLGRQPDRADLVLAQRPALLRCLDAVFRPNCGSYGSRGSLSCSITVLFDLGRFADRFEPDLLVGLLRQFRAPAAACARTRFDRLRADRHHRVLQPARRLGQDFEARAPIPGSGRAKLSSICWVSIDWVITSSPTNIDHAVDLVEIDADRLDRRAPAIVGTAAALLGVFPRQGSAPDRRPPPSAAWGLRRRLGRAARRRLLLHALGQVAKLSVSSSTGLAGGSRPSPGPLAG